MRTHLTQEDKDLVTGLINCREDLKKEVGALAFKMCAIKEQIRYLSNAKIGEKFEVTATTISRQAIIIKQSNL